LIPAVLLALTIGWLRSDPGERRRRVRALALSALACAAPVVAWLGVSRTSGAPVVAQIGPPAGTRPLPFSIRQFVSYVWQFYLPRVPGTAPFRPAGWGLYKIWLREGWGVFGWLDVWLATWVYAVIATVTAIVGTAAAIIIATFRDRLRWLLVAVFGL